MGRLLTKEELWSMSTQHAVAAAQDAKTHRLDVEWLRGDCPHRIVTQGYTISGLMRRECGKCWAEFVGRE